jgi:hypothetical protein
MLLAVPGIVLGLLAQWRLHSAYRRFSQLASKRGITGAKAARLLLDRNGMANVEIFEASGQMSDHFDPRRRAVFLSREVAFGNSIAAIAIAAHEVGHAIQNRVDYHFFRLRMFIVGMTGFATSASSIFFLLGLCLAGPISEWLLILAIALYLVFIFFQLVTLPVEFDASGRAKKEIIKHGLIEPDELKPVRTMLNAAALTYVAALLTSVFELIKLIGLAATRGAFSRNRD